MTGFEFDVKIDFGGFALVASYRDQALNWPSTCQLEAKLFSSITLYNQSTGTRVYFSLDAKGFWIQLV